MTISKEILDELLKGVERPEDLLGEAGLMKELKIKLMERMLGAELTAHLGYEEGKEVPPGQGNRRNGTSTKVLKGQDGEMPVAVPRDRDSRFEPELVKKGQTRIHGMDDKIVGLYAAGLTVRDIQAHLLDLYGLKVSPDLISRVTDAVLDEVREWQSRALDRMYPIVLFDALRVKIRDADSRMVKNKAVYVALGVTRDGRREVLGLWIAENEGAKFWLSVMNELKNRGAQDILIAIVDGLKGFPEAITAAFPDTMVQTCIVHLVRHSLNFCSWKDRKVVVADLRRIYSAPTADMAEAELDAFEEKWAGKYASIAPAWRRAWQEVIPFFGFDPAIRKIIYTTNAIESLNRVIRKSIKTRGSFPTDEAACRYPAPQEREALEDHHRRGRRVKRGPARGEIPGPRALATMERISEDDPVSHRRRSPRQQDRRAASLELHPVKLSRRAAEPPLTVRRTLKTQSGSLRIDKVLFRRLASSKTPSTRCGARLKSAKLLKTPQSLHKSEVKLQ